MELLGWARPGKICGWPSPSHLASLDERDQRGRALSGAVRWRKRGKGEGEGGEGQRRGRGRGEGGEGYDVEHYFDVTTISNSISTSFEN